VIVRPFGPLIVDPDFRRIITPDGQSVKWAHRYAVMTTLPLAWCPSMWATASAASLSG
jgi:hypothetical protein